MKSVTREGGCHPSGAVLNRVTRDDAVLTAING